MSRNASLWLTSFCAWRYAFWKTCGVFLMLGIRSLLRFRMRWLEWEDAHSSPSSSIAFTVKENSFTEIVSARKIFQLCFLSMFPKAESSWGPAGSKMELTSLPPSFRVAGVNWALVLAHTHRWGDLQTCCNYSAIIIPSTRRFSFWFLSL